MNTTHPSILLFDTILERHVCDSFKDALESLGCRVNATGPVWRGHRFPDSHKDMDTIRVRLDQELEFRPDIFFVFRASTLTPELIQRAKRSGCTTVVWFPDDPVLYDICYRHVVDEYDVVLHCGPERILRFYKERGHQSGVNFPFWAAPSRFPYCYDPERVQYDLVFLGNCAGQVRRARYDFIASLPVSARIFGRVDDDPFGLHGGVIADGDNELGGITSALSRARVALSIPQFFSAYRGTKYDFPGLNLLGEFLAPSRIIQYAASGIPILSHGSNEIRDVFPEVATAATRQQAARILHDWLRDDQYLIDLSRRTRERFLLHFSAEARARLLIDLVEHDHWRSMSTAERTNYYMQHTGMGEDVIAQTMYTATQLPPPVAEQRQELVRRDIRSEKPCRILTIGTAIGGDSDIVSCLIRALENIGHDVLHLDFRHFQVLEHTPKIISGMGPHFVDYDRLAPYLDRFNPSAVICIAAGLALRPEDAAKLHARGVLPLGLTLSDPDVQPSMIDHVSAFLLHGTNSELALQHYEEAGLTNTVLFPFGIDRGYASAEIASLSEFEADVICMAHAKGRPDRVEAMEVVQQAVEGIRLYGYGWGKSGRGPIKGLRQLQAMRGGRIHINFPRTRAGYTNVKCGVFESVASGGVICTERFPEMERYFHYDDEIVGYTDAADLATQLVALKNDSERVEQIRRRAFARLASEHLYEHRWLRFFEQVEERLAKSNRTLAPSGAPKRRVLAVGFYGAQNLGDELILRAIDNAVGGLDGSNKLIVAAENPTVVTRDHAISAFSRCDIHRAEIEVRAASAVILGGGGLWHDYSFACSDELTGLFSGSDISITGYSKIPLLCRILGRPLHIYGMGVGPLENENARQYVRFIAEQASTLVVRDERSKELLESIAGWSKPVQVFPDPVYALDIEAAPLPQDIQELMNGRRLLAVNLRPWMGHNEDFFIERMVRVLNRLATEYELSLVGIPLHPQDTKIIQRVFAKLPKTIPRGDIKAFGAGGINQVIGLLKASSAVLAMRLHACLLAHRVGAATVGLSYDPKVSVAFEHVGIGELALPIDARESSIITTVADALEHAGDYETRIASRLDSLEKGAHDGLRFLRRALGEAPPVRAPLMTPRIPMEPRVRETIRDRHWVLTENVDLGFESKVWVRPTKPDKIWRSELSEGRLRVHFDLAGSRCYMTQDNKEFNEPPARATSGIKPSTDYQLRIAAELSGSSPNVDIWLIEYSSDKRLQHQRQRLSQGETAISFRTHREAEFFRILLRFTGTGYASLDAPMLFLQADQPGLRTTRIQNITHDYKQPSWDKLYSSHEGTFEYGNLTSWKRDIFLELARRIPEKGSLLSVGCGKALIEYWLVRVFGINAHLLDISEPLLGKVHRSFGHVPHHLYAHDALHLPFSDEMFDVCWNAGVWEHFPEEEIYRGIHEMARVSKKTVIVSVPYSECRPYILAKEWLEKNGKWLYGDETPKSSMRKYFEAAGLEMVCERHIGGKQTCINYLNMIPNKGVRDQLYKKISPEDFLVGPHILAIGEHKK